MKIQDGNFLRNIKQPIGQPAFFQNWMMLYYNPEDAKKFFEIATKCGETYGIKLKQPIKAKPKSSNKQDYLDAITQNF